MAITPNRYFIIHEGEKKDLYNLLDANHTSNLSWEDLDLASVRFKINDAEYGTITGISEPVYEDEDTFTEMIKTIPLNEFLYRDISDDSGNISNTDNKIVLAGYLPILNSTKNNINLEWTGEAEFNLTITREEDAILIESGEDTLEITNGGAAPENMPPNNWSFSGGELPHRLAIEIQAGGGSGGSGAPNSSGGGGGGAGAYWCGIVSLDEGKIFIHMGKSAEGSSYDSENSNMFTTGNNAENCNLNVYKKDGTTLGYVTVGGGQKGYPIFVDEGWNGEGGYGGEVKFQDLSYGYGSKYIWTIDSISGNAGGNVGSDGSAFSGRTGTDSLSYIDSSESRFNDCSISLSSQRGGKAGDYGDNTPAGGGGASALGRGGDYITVTDTEKPLYILYRRGVQGSGSAGGNSRNDNPYSFFSSAGGNWVLKIHY